MLIHVPGSIIVSASAAEFPDLAREFFTSP